MKKLIYMTVIAGLAALYTSCETYDAAEIPEKYQKVLVLKEAGEINLTLYRTGEDATYELCIMKDGSGDGLTADANLVVSQEWLDNFNTDNASGYTMIPSQYYSLDSENIKFAGNDKYKTVKVNFKTTELEALISDNSEKKYVLPIQLESDNTTISESNRYVILQPTVVVPSISFDKTGYQKTIITAQINNPVCIEIPISLPLDNKWDFECSVKVDKEWLDIYNTKHGTSYQLLPDESYELQEICQFNIGDSKASIRLDVDRNSLSVGDYALPIKLESCTQNGFKLDNGYYLAGISYLPPQIPLSLDMLSANATEPSADGTGLTGLIDGVGSGKHYHSSWSVAVTDAKYGHYIDVHLTTPIQSIMFDYYTRFENGNGDPIKIAMYTSNDGQTWTELGTVSKNGLGGNAEYTSPIFTAESKFTYWRFSVTKSAAGDVTAGAYFNLGELSIYGQ